MSKSPSHNYHVTELFDQFINGTTLKSVLITFRRICLLLDLEPGPFNQFYPTLKKGIVCNKNWKSQSIFSKIEKKAFNKIYHASSSNSGRSSGTGGGSGHHHHHHHHSSSHGSNCVLKNHNCLVIGGGPCGLRTAIELQLLGARHVIITEKRDRFSRNNVLHLWPFVIADLKQLAGKKFYGKFCAGSIDHVSIRQLQLMLLKVALIIGCEFIENVTFEEVCPHNIPPSRETLKETSPESEVDGSGTSKVQQSAQNLKQSPAKRKLYSTAEEIESNNKNGTNSDSSTGMATITTNNDNQENKNIFNTNNNNSDEAIDCSPTDDYHGVGSGTGKTESRRLSICSCCCHLHRSGDSGRRFWPHLPKNYIGAYAHFSLTSSTPSTATTLVNYDLLLKKLHTYQFDILIGGDGRRNTLNDNFPRKEFRGKLAIAITANFINNHTLAEAQIPEISGISFIYHQEMFKSLYDETGIDLENICYYKDDTHYFVMTAKKSSLLQRGVLINDYSDTRALLDSSNIDRSQLLAYARDAAKWTTGLDTPNFALNHYGEADVAMFDFTSMYAADNACRAKRIVRTSYGDHNCSRCNCDNEPCKKSKSDTINDDYSSYKEASDENTKDLYNSNNYNSREEGADGEGVAIGSVSVPDEGLLLISLVGDSLLEPFWPTGSGCGRGFLSAMDAAWLARQWSVKKCKSIKDEEKIMQVLSERESIYRLLAQTKSENLSQNCASYTINPVTRYPNLNSSTLLPHQCRHLLYDHLPLPVIEPRSRLTMAEKRARRATIATTAPFSGGTGASGEGEVIVESRARVEREFMAISRERERNQRNNVPNVNNNGERLTGHGGRAYLTGGSISVASATLEDDENNLMAHREFEDSLAAFEENYRGLMASDADPAESGGIQLSTSVPNRSHIHNAANFGLDLSPSASNLISMAKSRARDIESAFRHRRQRQSQFRRSETTDVDDLFTREGGSGKAHQKAQQQCINHLRQQLRSKAAWFLDQRASEAANADKDDSSPSAIIKRGSFNERIKDLEAKLYAASGLSYLSDENSDPGKDETPAVRLPSTKTGINVMMTATQLQQLLNPKFQEEKLRQEAKLKATKDIKYVGKISKQDWNVKPFEESTESNKVANSKPKSPPPPQRVQLFRNKLNDIQSKLEHIDDHHQPERRNKLEEGQSGNSNGEWISMLKNELTEKATRKPDILAEPVCLRRSPSTIDNPFRKEARREAAAAAKLASKSPTSPKEKITIVEGSSSTVYKVCAKCGLIVATVDKILISGTLFHRSCLKCISCGATLRMSEVRNTNGNNPGSLASLITGSVTVFNNNKEGSSKENGFNYKCTNCSNGNANTNKSRFASTTTSSVIGKLIGSNNYGNHNLKSSITSLSSAASSSSSSGITTIDNRMTSSFDGNLEPLAKSMSARLINKMASTTDDYEVRLKERMKWKEMFLLNNNNIDSRSTDNVNDGQSKTDGGPSVVNTSSGGNNKKKITSLLSSGQGESRSTSKGKESVTTPDSYKNRVNERIEYENISMTSEMVDDDELTRLLNISADHWKSDRQNDKDDEDDDDDEDAEGSNDSDKEDSEEDDDENNRQGKGCGDKNIVNSSDENNHHDNGGDEDEDDGDDDDDDRQTTTSDSWDSSDSTDNDFDSDQFDESGVSDGGDLLGYRSRRSSSTVGFDKKHHHQQQPNAQTAPVRQESIKEEKLRLPQIVVHKESNDTVVSSSVNSPTKPSNNDHQDAMLSSDNTEGTSYQPDESLSTTTVEQSSELITSSDDITPISSSTLKEDKMIRETAKEGEEGEGDEDKGDDSDKTEKNSSSRSNGTDDSDTINSKINDLEDRSSKKPSPIHTIKEEQEFQLIVDEMERKSNQVINNQTHDNRDDKKALINKISPTADQPIPSLTGNINFDSDDDSRTSLSSLSINVSDTYDDINLLSVWDESGNCDEFTDSSDKRNKSSKKSKTKKSASNRNNKETLSGKKRAGCGKLTNDRHEDKRGAVNGLYKSKTEASIPGRHPHRSTYNRNDYLGRGLAPLESSSSSSTVSSRITLNDAKKLTDYTTSVNDSFNDEVNPMVKMSPPSKGEVYSKIPILAARVNAVNESINLESGHSPSTTTTTAESSTGSTMNNKNKYKPSYSGSFTEKLLQRCRSSPSIPFIGDSLSRWSTPKLQISSPTKVLTKALNAQAKNAINSTSSPPQHSPSVNHQLPWQKLLTKSQQNEPSSTLNHQQSTLTTKRQQTHSSLPFADSENTHSTQHQSEISQQKIPFKQSNRQPISPLVTSSSSSSSSTRGQMKTSPNQFRQTSNPTLPRVTGTTVKSDSSSKLFHAPRATFDEDFDDEDEIDEKTISPPEQQQSHRNRSNNSSNASSNHHRNRHRSPNKSTPTTSVDSNQIKLKPIKIDYNY